MYKRMSQQGASISGYTVNKLQLKSQVNGHSPQPMPPAASIILFTTMRSFWHDMITKCEIKFWSLREPPGQGRPYGQRSFSSWRN